MAPNVACWQQLVEAAMCAGMCVCVVAVRAVCCVCVCVCCRSVLQCVVYVVLQCVIVCCTGMCVCCCSLCTVCCSVVQRVDVTSRAITSCCRKTTCLSLSPTHAQVVVARLHASQHYNNQPVSTCCCHVARHVVVRQQRVCVCVCVCVSCCPATTTCVLRQDNNTRTHRRRAQPQPEHVVSLQQLVQAERVVVKLSRDNNVWSRVKSVCVVVCVYVVMSRGM